MILLVSPSREELLADDGLNQYCIIIRTVVIANFFIDDAAEEQQQEGYRRLSTSREIYESVSNCYEE